MPKLVTLTMRGGPKDGATFEYPQTHAGGLPGVFVFQGLFGPERVFSIHNYRKTGPQEYTWADICDETHCATSDSRID